MSDLVNAGTSLWAAPFQSSAPKFDYWGVTHRQAAERLRLACKAPGLLTLFTGRGGGGKSTVARRVVWDNQEESLIGVVPHSAVLCVDPCRAILTAFGADSGSNGKDGCYEELSDYLRQTVVQLALPTLIVDDAHRLPKEKQQTLVELAGFELKAGPLFKIVLVGHTGLLDQIGACQMGLLGPQFQLEPMAKEDTLGYVQHRFAAAGAGAMPFTDAALDVIHELTDGNPVRINLLCMQVLDEAEMQWIETIDGDMVRECYNPARMALDLVKVTGVRFSPTAVSNPVGKLGDPSATPSRLEAPPKKDAQKTPAMLAYETATAPKQKPPMAQPIDTAASSPQLSATLCAKPADTSESVGKISSVSASDVAKRALPDRPGRPRAVVLGKEWIVPAASHGSALSNGQALAVANKALTPERRSGGFRTAATGTGLAAAVAAIAWINLASDEPADQTTEIYASVTKEAPQLSEMVVQASISDLNLPPIRSVPAVYVVVDRDALAKLDQIRSVVGILPKNSIARFRRAIAVADQQPQAAVVAYALAAYDEHPRAAYYLAQIYEVGEGIPVDLVLARSWYKRAVANISGAARRLEALPQSGPVTPIAPPVLLYAGKLETGGIELVWTSAEGGDPATYAVDFADRSGRIVQRESNLELSALRTVVPEGAVYWRVEASASEGGETAVGGWLPIGPDVSALPPDALADLKAPLR